jgi:DNA-binding winged helix-turn-helix (wHTH) protein/Tol biopolymer transport system component
MLVLRSQISGMDMHRTRQRFGIFEIDTSAGELYRRGILVHLENHPFLVLVVLLEHAGEVVSREELRQTIWRDGTHVGFEAGLNTAMRKLRQALGDSAEMPVFIETLPRRGYRFIAPVTELSNSTNEATDDSELMAIANSVSKAVPAPSHPVTSMATSENSPTKGRSRRMALLMGAAIALVTGLSLWHGSAAERVPAPRPIETRLPGAQTWQALGISPDGRYVAYAYSDGARTALRLRQVLIGGEVEILPPDKAYFRGLTFSLDGNYLYFVRSDRENLFYSHLYRMPALGGAVQKLISDVDSPVSFAPDGQKLVFARFRSVNSTLEIRTANADGSAEELLAYYSDANPKTRMFVSWSPDGRTVAVSFRRNSGACLSAIDTANHRTRELYVNGGFVGRAVWMPDGRTLVFPTEDKVTERGQLWTLEFPKGEPHRLTSDLSSYAAFLDLSRDGRTGIAVDRKFQGDLWIVPATQLSRPKVVTAGEFGVVGAEELTDGKILVEDNDASLWVMNTDGSRRAVFSDVQGEAEVCGEFVLVQPDGNSGLLRFDADGTHGKELIRGFAPVSFSCANDDSMFYVNPGPTKAIYRVPIHGGTPVEIAKTLGNELSSPLAVSRDGQLIAYAFWQNRRPNVLFAVVRAKDGSRVALLEPSDATAGGITDLHWSPDNKALQYISLDDAQNNVWEQPLSGGKARRLTQFDSGLISSFSWSRDGKRLILARGPKTNDIVLLKGLQ